ncbi:MAG: glycosyltransferase [Acidimicrobiia bacterium]|nr:glycosyltransferase [bacterium]MXX46358.1 glycosyltransferase [Acidimicrobiia bacterium]MYD41600.1 glycosyltransferase [Acidimicrobiia bacterium]
MTELERETRDSRSGPGVPFSVLMPAYNETDVIGTTLAELLEYLPHDAEVVVAAADQADGSLVRGERSPTGERALAGGDRRVRVCDGGGLAEAVRNAAHAARHDLVVVMDADGQHDPAAVKEMMAALADGYDLCVGELEQQGKEWYRMALTRTSILLTRLRMPRRTRGLRFPQSGFFGTHRSVLAEALEGMAPHGFKVLVAVLMSRRLQATGVETVIRDRVAGESKLNWRTIASDARLLLRRCGR